MSALHPKVDILTEYPAYEHFPGIADFVLASILNRGTH